MLQLSGSTKWTRWREFKYSTAKKIMYERKHANAIILRKSSGIRALLILAHVELGGRMRVTVTDGLVISVQACSAHHVA